MNIKWAYYFIAALYVILVILRGINYLNKKAYIKENADIQKVFTIKKDFFTTVATICILITLCINLAAIISGKALNTSSIIVTLLVLGFTLLNSVGVILFSEKNKTVHFVGYTLKQGDIQEMKVRAGKKRTGLNITFNREVESYNYTRAAVYGENREKLIKVLSELKSEAK